LATLAASRADPGCRTTSFGIRSWVRHSARVAALGGCRPSSVERGLGSSAQPSDSRNEHEKTKNETKNEKNMWTKMWKGKWKWKLKLKTKNENWNWNWNWTETEKWAGPANPNTNHKID
jgi:hypothetical protein